MDVKKTSIKRFITSSDMMMIIYFGEKCDEFE